MRSAAAPASSFLTKRSICCGERAMMVASRTLIFRNGKGEIYDCRVGLCARTGEGKAFIQLISTSLEKTDPHESNILHSLWRPLPCPVGGSGLCFSSSCMSDLDFCLCLFNSLLWLAENLASRLFPSLWLAEVLEIVSTSVTR
jgi:hypothetical protein